jgi:hypothetical protein
MRRAALFALLALPLLGFDCGEDPSPSGGSTPTPCTLTVGGAVSEQLWCVATVFDYSQLDPLDTTYAFELVAYRGLSEVGVGAGFFLPTRAQVRTPYGWDSSTGATNVDSGFASRYDVSYAETHSAMAPFGDWGTGGLSVTFSSLPAPGASDAEMINVHGALTATLPSTTTGGDVTLSATF